MNRLHALTTHISPAAAEEEHVPGTSATYEVVDHVGETSDTYHLSSLLRPHPTPLPQAALRLSDLSTSRPLLYPPPVVA